MPVFRPGQFDGILMYFLDVFVYSAVQCCTMLFIILHSFLRYNSNKTIWMFYRKFADKGDNPVNNPNIYNVENSIDELLISLGAVIPQIRIL